ncbi:carboxypeptidase-like regulatory domain-containing protein, partial [Mesorhizobium marinum]
MTLARWQATIVDESGNVLPSATVTVRNELTGGLQPLFSDRAGASSKGNPFTADANGFAFFHALGGAYRITAT